MTCKGNCIKYVSNTKKKGGRYLNGQKRCQACEIFIIWNGLFCPCCGIRLRTRPRTMKYKEQYYDNKKNSTTKELKTQK